MGTGNQCRMCGDTATKTKKFNHKKEQIILCVDCIPQVKKMIKDGIEPIFFLKN